MAASKDKLSWWQLFQGSPYPAYVTCIHLKVFGMTLNKGMQQVSELAVDDILDTRGDPDQWQPTTFTLKKGSSVFVLPSDADSAGKQIVSQPWMVRINRMWFKGGKKTRTAKTDSNTENHKKIIKWEEQQLRDMRISVQHFLLEVNYFYRLSDLVGEHAFEGKGQAARNRKTMCQALAKLGIVETIPAAEELISKRNVGTSRAGRLLNRFVAFSTHEAKVIPGGNYGDDSSNSEEGSEEEEGEDDEDDEAEEGEEQADTPIPMESVMGIFKVMFLRASQGAPYVPAPVAQAAEQRQTKTHKRAALLEEVQQQHMELPSGFLCSLIYIKQTGQLLVLEDWANGKAGADLKEDWAKHSRQETKQLLQQTQQELADLRKKRELQLAGRRASGLHALADAAAGAAADDDADDAEYVSISDGDAAAADQQLPGSPAQQQHSQQVTTPLRQPQRKTPRKSHNPRMAQTQQQQSGQKPQRRRLRPAAAAAGGDDALDNGQIVSSDGSDIVLEPDLDDSEQQEDDVQQQQQQQAEEEEEEEGQPPPQKKRRAAAAQEHSGSSGTEDEGEGDSREEGDAGGDADADGDHAANNQQGDSEGDAESSSSEEESTSSETEESGADSQEAAAAAAAGAKGSKVAPAAGKREAAAAKPKKRGRGRPPKAAAAAAGGNRSTRSAMKTSKGAVLRNGK